LAGIGRIRSLDAVSSNDANGSVSSKEDEEEEDDNEEEDDDNEEEPGEKKAECVIDEVADAPDREVKLLRCGSACAASKSDSSRLRA